MSKINLPTKITIARICLIPLMLLFFFLQDLASWIVVFTLITFLVAAGTDFIDGKLARKRNEVTTLGKFLDPIADKLLVIISLILILDRYMGIYSSVLGNGSRIVFIVIAITIIARELIISGFRQLAATKGIIMQADIFGKIKTFETFIAIGFSFLIEFTIYNRTFGRVMSYISFILWIVAFILTILSAFNYFFSNKVVFEDDHIEKDENGNVVGEQVASDQIEMIKPDDPKSEMFSESNEEEKIQDVEATEAKADHSAEEEKESKISKKSKGTNKKQTK